MVKKERNNNGIGAPIYWLDLSHIALKLTIKAKRKNKNYLFFIQLSLINIKLDHL